MNIERLTRDRADAWVVELGGGGVWTPTTVGFGIGTLSCFPTDVPTDGRSGTWTSAWSTCIR